MDLLNKLFDFFADKSRKLSHRAAVIIIITTSIIIVNDQMDFSYNYRLEHKIKHAQSISDILRNTDLPTNTRTELINMVDESLQRKSFFEHFYLKFNSKILNPVLNGSVAASEQGYIILQLITSAGVTIVILGFLLFYTAFGYHHDSFIKRTAIGILVLSFGLAIIFLQYSITSAIPPQIYGSWTWNYAINLVIQIAFYTILYLSLKWLANKSKDDSSLDLFNYRYRISLIRFKKKDA